MPVNSYWENHFVCSQKLILARSRILSSKRLWILDFWKVNFLSSGDKSQEIAKVMYIEKRETIDRVISQFSTHRLERLPGRPKVFLVYLPCKNRVRLITKPSRCGQKKLDSSESPSITMKRVTAANKDINKSKWGPSPIPLPVIFTFKKEKFHRIGASRTSFVKIIRIQTFQVYEYPNTRITLDGLNVKLMAWQGRFYRISNRGLGTIHKNVGGSSVRSGT